MAKSKTFKKLSKKILKSDVAIWLISKLALAYIIFVKITTKWEVRGLENLNGTLEKHKSAIGLCWHSRALMLPALWNYKYPIRALVSPHQDGRIVAGILHSLGIKTIDGSSNNNASGAALSILRALNNDCSIGMVPDGPRGPRQKMSVSPIYFAQKSGRPIICVVYSTKNSKIVEKSWDKMMLPKPFSKGIFIVSKPIFIPRNIDTKDLETYRLTVENELNNIQNEADKFTGTPIILPNNQIKHKRYKK